MNTPTLRVSQSVVVISSVTIEGNGEIGNAIFIIWALVILYLLFHITQCSFKFRPDIRSVLRMISLTNILEGYSGLILLLGKHYFFVSNWLCRDQKVTCI